MGWALKIIVASSALLLFGCGSYQPEIGDSPFLCADTEIERCPAEHHCVEGICLPEGWQPPPDGGVDGDVDDAGDSDASVQDGGG